MGHARLRAAGEDGRQGSSVRAGQSGRGISPVASTGTRARRLLSHPTPLRPGRRYLREQKEREARIKASRPKDSWWTSHVHKGNDYRKVIDATTSAGWSKTKGEVPAGPTKQKASDARPETSELGWLSSTWAA